MRKAALVVLGAVAALVAAAAAMAAVFTAGGITSTTASLNTSQVADLKTRTCTGGDNKTFTVTDARYTGTADFTNPGSEFDGPLTIHARITVDTASKLGVVEGTFRVKDGDSRVSGRLWGTIDSSNVLSGFLTGASRGNHAVVFGTLGGKFIPGSGLTGTLGTGSVPALAVLAGPVCKGQPKPAPAPKPKSVTVHGTISALGQNPSSITVTAKGPTTSTCLLDGSSPALTGFNMGDKVEMKCVGVVSNNTTSWYLRELKKEK